ncbi:hypothetical protein ARALYDRAFT_900175 [Arabidopsis lyrata subsp. lyrata]|uniref:Uncharacterized protein n=1 Tax=Arabidopsis lyrata subsp. lyrata TaxID=81972 RepID=D7LAF6_ARALL|nr:hypothetical protein ARALYDRAFT_900175 [Arabidopsis lyrata subsp. lyrata]
MSLELGFILITTFTAIVSCLTLSHALLHPSSVSHNVSRSSYYLTTNELWFNQTLDHDSPNVTSLHRFLSFFNLTLI